MNLRCLLNIHKYIITNEYNFTNTTLFDKLKSEQCIYCDKYRYLVSSAGIYSETDNISYSTYTALTKYYKVEKINNREYTIKDILK